jgi:flagellar FliL protein
VSANPNAAPVAPAPAKSKKLIVIVAIVAVLAIVAAAAYVLMMQRQHSSADGEEEVSAKATVPTFLPLDNMVANLADPGGDRFVQLGITLELADEKGFHRQAISARHPQRHSDAGVPAHGRRAAGARGQGKAGRRHPDRGLGAAGLRPERQKRSRDDEDADEDSPRANRKGPVRRVLFSSFIIQ